MIEVKILGPISMSIGDEPVIFGDLKQRILLGVLAWENGLVNRDRLVRLLWEENGEPHLRYGQIHGHVAGIRRAIKAASATSAVRLETVREVGYRLGVSAEDIDYHQFRALAEQAQAALASDPEAAAAHARSALEKWGGGLTRLRGGGMPFGTLKVQLDPIIKVMRDQYQAALMTYLNAEIACGRHAQLIAPMAVLAADGEEAAHCQELAYLRALALDRAGKRWDALKILHQVEEHAYFDEATVKLMRDLSQRRAAEPAVEVKAEPAPPVVAEPNPQVKSAYSLQITDGQGRVSSPYYLHDKPGGIRIGRSVAHESPPDIVVASGSPSPVSRKHAWLCRKKGSWSIIPNGKNETKIRYRGRSEAEPLKSATKLRNGDVVIIQLLPDADRGERNWEMKFIDPDETNTI